MALPWSPRFYRLLLWAAFLIAPGGISWAQLTTMEHLAKPGFWPTKTTHNPDDFVGTAACAGCHAQITASQKFTSMAKSASRAHDDESLHSHPHLDFQQGRFKYEIVTSAAASTYTVTDGERSASATLTWAFGAGTIGQSYLYAKEGRWYEARVSFFGSLHSLQFTPGRALTSPRDLQEAMSRPVGREEVTRCFQCHATGVTSVDPSEPSAAWLGIGCEACHGPGKRHVTAMNLEALNGVGAAGADDHFIFNPARLNPADSVDFCGACHSTFWDVRLSSASAHASIVSPVFRLQSSKCWGKGDSRLTCLTCHDPHQPIDRRPESYDSKCLACHLAARGLPGSADHPAPVCPVGKAQCSSCHMPKTEVPELHYALADHEIRVVGAAQAH